VTALDQIKPEEATFDDKMFKTSTRKRNNCPCGDKTQVHQTIELYETPKIMSLTINRFSPASD